MNEIIFMGHEPPEGGYAAEALGYSIFTGADTLEELNEMISEPVLCHFDDDSRSKIIRLHFVREEVIAVLPRDRWETISSGRLRDSDIRKRVRPVVT